MLVLLIVALVLVVAVGYLRVRLDRAEAEIHRLQAMLEDGEAIRGAAAREIADAPVVMRLHLTQDR